MIILGIDPGTTESGYCYFDGAGIIESGVAPNEEVKRMIRQQLLGVGSYDLLAIEMIASYGMPVGASTFETCVWIGRFIENSTSIHEYVYRKDVKINLCKSLKAKDTNIKQAIIDRLGPQGTKKNPGPLYGVKSHAWSALAVALTAYDKKRV